MFKEFLGIENLIILKTLKTKICILLKWDIFYVLLTKPIFANTIINKYFFYLTIPFFLLNKNLKQINVGRKFPIPENPKN